MATTYDPHRSKVKRFLPAPLWALVGAASVVSLWWTMGTAWMWAYPLLLMGSLRDQGIHESRYMHGEDEGMFSYVIAWGGLLLASAGTVVWAFSGFPPRPL